MQPHASELEEAIIGACLIEQEALPLVADKLRPEMFYDDHHQLIFAALIAMYQANKKIDILTVKEELTRRGVLEKIGGPYTIVQLSSRVASSAHIEYHAQIVHQKYLAREAVVGFNKLLTCAMDETIDIDDTLIDAHNLLDRLEGESGHHDHMRCMDTLMTDTLKEAELRIAKSVNGVTGIPTAQLQAQALAMMTQLSTELHTKLDALDAAIAAVESGSFYTKAEADAKFGTPYTLPAATAAQLGGVKVGEALDIAADGTLSAKTLNDKIAAAVAVKSEPRLVWNHYEETGKRWKTYDIKMPDGLDYVHVKTRYNDSSHAYGEEVDIAKGGTANHSYGNGTGIFASNTTFQTNGTLHFATETSTGGYTVEIWLTGYHYPTLAELVAETQAAQADTDALAVDQEYRVAMLELGLTDDTTTDTTT